MGANGADILDLPGLVTVAHGFDPANRVCVLNVEPAEAQIDCPSCPKCGQQPYRHGTPTATYRDSPIREYAVVISLKLQKFRCKPCETTFLQSVEGFDHKRLMTTRCVEYIREQALLHTFVHVAQHIGCHEKTVRSIAKEYIDELNAGHKLYVPEWLGIDETELNGKMRCVLTDVVNRRPIDILPNREKPTVAEWLWQFRESKDIRGVTIDMWRPFQKAAAFVFPNLPVIVDKFHVVRLANEALDNVRIRHGKGRTKEERAKWLKDKFMLRKHPTGPRSLSEDARKDLDEWLQKEPDIETAYHLKEEFFRIYSFVKRHEAERALDAWRRSVPKHLHPDFQKLLSATKNWKKEILAYFDHVDSNGNRISNAYTETFNGESKVSNRAGRGYTFEVLRARVLFREKFVGLSDIFTEKMSQAGLDEALNEARKQLPPPQGQCMSCLKMFPTNRLLYCRTKSGAIGVVCEGCADQVAHQGPLSFNPERFISDNPDSTSEVD